MIVFLAPLSLISRKDVYLNHYITVGNLCASVEEWTVGRTELTSLMDVERRYVWRQSMESSTGSISSLSAGLGPSEYVSGCSKTSLLVVLTLIHHLFAAHGFTLCIRAEGENRH
ncbi:uncharacterized protein LOC131642617 [Vicia villosa]|uniref:uncharacterized protein LOC131642617 n=1 Tax=Vicia villosa TaxID=3911 RepID=UPI00273BD7FE|nr:uncharacterized protein LOC131642617 [Vicia villosa]